MSEQGTKLPLSQLETLRLVERHETNLCGEGADGWWLAEVLDRTPTSAENRLLRLASHGYLKAKAEMDRRGHFYVYFLTDKGREAIR